MWLGVDLGTTNSVAYRVPGDVVPSPLCETLTPSVVSVGPSEVLCGGMAEGADPKRTFFGFKRTIGRRFKDTKLWRSAVVWPFPVVSPENPEHEPVYPATLGSEMLSLTPRDLYVHLLRYMLKEVDLSEFEGAVLTVPAHFDTVQRDATRDAAKRAGLGNVHILNEPTAAAVAFLDSRPDTHGRILVVDVGGGTVDCTLLEVDRQQAEVLDKAGTSEVGGEVITDRLVARKRAKGKRETIEKLKKMVSVQQEATVDGVRLTRDEVESVAEPVITAVCDLATKVGGRDPPPRAIVLCGGTTRMPGLRKRLAEVYPDAELSLTLNPLTAVARGAALYGSMQRAAAPPQAPVRVSDVVSATVGLRIREDEVFSLLRGNTPLPAAASQRFRPMSAEQDHVELVVVQGDHPEASQNVELGRFRLGPHAITLRCTADEGGCVDLVAIRDTGEEVLVERVLQN